MKKIVVFLLILAFCVTGISVSGATSEEAVKGWYHLDGTDGISAGNMAYLQPTDGVSELIKFDVNSTELFTDRTGKLPKAMPDCFRGAMLLRNSLDKGTSFKAVSAGDVYILTPPRWEVSQKDELMAMGFTVVVEDIANVSSGIGEKLTLLKKKVNAGDEFTIGKWSIVFSGNSSVITPNVYTYPDDAKIIEESRFADTSKEEAATYGYVSGTRLWQGISGIEYIEYSKYEQTKTKSGGRLWATWYSGGRGEGAYNYVVLATSVDEGVTWTDARVIIDPDNIGNVRAFDPVLWTDPNGKMWVFWNQEFGYTTSDPQKGVWGMYTDNPYEQDPTWSAPVRLCNGVMMNKPAIIKDENDNEAWILSSYIRVAETAISAEYGPNLYKFTGYGKTWETFANINGESELVPPNEYLEHMLVQNDDGSLRVLIRSAVGILDVVSADYGKTWSGGELMTDSEGNLITTTVSRVYIGSIQDSDGKVTGKTQLLVYHNNTTGARDNLTAAISEDGGKTWPYKLTLHASTGCSYPDAVQISDGTIYVTYDYNRYGQKQILFSKITVEDIKAGKLTNSTSKLSAIINENKKTYTADWYKLSGTEDVSVSDMAYLMPTDGKSQLTELKIGIEIFTDRKGRHTTFAVPDCFKGAMLLKNSMDSGASFKAVTSGDLYVMTPATSWYSQKAYLEGVGFTTIVSDMEAPISSDAQERMVLMKKTVAAGDEFTIGKWSIVFSGPVKTTGDVNLDGITDAADLALLRKKIIGDEENGAYYYDANADQAINVLDLVWIHNRL
jgi:hypothetical protein